MATVKVNIKRRYRTDKLIFSNPEEAEAYIGRLDGFLLIDYIFGANHDVKQINIRLTEY